MGRVKLEIRKIENPTNRQVTYSKRRNGLIKKAYELSVLCEIDIALLMFSPSGRLNHFAGKKRIEDVIARFATLSDHERSKSQCLKWCITDDQQGPNAPRKIENPELLLKAAKKLKQESYITTTTIGGQFSSSRSTSLETVQYEIQRTQAQLHEMENRLRIYEGDVKCVDSVQQLENLEQHLHNALETLRLHKQAMEGSSCQAAVPRPFMDASGSSSQLLYGMQLQQQEVAGGGGGNSISSNCSSMLHNANHANANHANNATNCSSNPQQNIIHHWLSAYSQNAVAAAAHHANIMATPIADHPPMGTIINPSMRESPGECSSATSTLYNRGLTGSTTTPPPPTTTTTTTTTTNTPPDHHHHHHRQNLHHGVLQNPNSNSSPLSDQAATTSQTLSHNLAFSAARSQWTASSSVSPYHHHHLHQYSNENNHETTTANYATDENGQDSKSIICSNLKDMDPNKLSSQNYNSSLYEREEGNDHEMMHHHHGHMNSQEEVVFHSQSPEADHQYQQWGANPLSLSQAQAVMGMMLARTRQQAAPQQEDDDQQQPELINIMSFNHQMNPNHNSQHIYANPNLHLYPNPNPNHQIGMQHILHHHQQQQESARTEASVLSTCTMHELPAGDIMNQMRSHQHLLPRHVHDGNGDGDEDDGHDDDDDDDHDEADDDDDDDDDDDMNIMRRDDPHQHAEHREDINGHDLSLGSSHLIHGSSSSAPIRYS